MNRDEMDEIKRHFGVVAEGLEHKIQLVAEGVTNLNEKFDREISSFREENEQAHREILSAIKFSYAELDQGAFRISDSGLRMEKAGYKSAIRNLNS